MAELSAETQAIIQRLKDEGELVRNRGTNSIRSVKIEMSKFQDVFNTISANVIEQTSILRQQAGFAAEALEAQRTKEQFDELQKETEERNTFSEPDSRETDEKIDRIGDSIANAFSLKNLALGAAGIFFGYNLLKGFVDQQYNGAWSEMEEGIGALGPRLREFANFDFDAIRSQFDTLTSDISGMNLSLQRMSTSIENIANIFERIAEISWGDVANYAFAMLTSFGVAAAALRLKLTNMRLQLINGTRTVSGQTWWQRALGIGARADAPTTRGARFNPDGTVRGPGQSARPGPGPAPTPATPAGAARAPAGGRGSYGMDTPEARAQLRAGVAASLPDQFRVDSRGRLQRVTGGIVSDAEAARILESTVRSMPPKYSRIYNRLLSLITRVGLPVLAVWTSLQIALILANESMTDEEKMQALAPIFGSIFGGIGFGILGAAVGSFSGPWGTLIGGIVGGVGGSIAGETLGLWLAKALFSEDPSDEDRRRINAQREALANAANEFAGLPESMGGPATAASVPITPAPPRGGGRGTIVEQPGERAAYMRQREGAVLDALIEAERNSQIEQQRLNDDIRSLEEYLGIEPGSNRQRELDVVGQNGGAAPIVVINAPTTVSPTVNNVSGGKSVNQVSVRTGGGNGFGGGTSNPYGLPYAVN
jgi:hypothetical protein